MQMSAKIKRQRTEQLTDLLAKIHYLKNLNKQNTTQKIWDQLFTTSQDLRINLIFQHDNQLHSLKAHSHHCGNKAGKILANQLKEKIVKQKFLNHKPQIKTKSHKPKRNSRSL